MPQFLAIEWDSRECRVAIGSHRNRKAAIEHAFAFAHGEESPEQLGAKIAAELDARGCGRPEAMVSVGRTRIELRQFTVPPAPDDDLPDMVRFQAAREFNELDEQWRLDFLPIDAASDGPRVVLATAISPAEIAAIEKVCQSAGVILRRIVLRPCEAASLLGSGDEKPQLLIEIFADAVDLTVVEGGKTVFLRTTRFAGDRPPVPALLAEIRLTLAAARNQLGAGSGEQGAGSGMAPRSSLPAPSLVLCGHDPSDAALAKELQSELGLPVTLLDPFASLAAAPSLAGTMPEHADRYAPLLGMLQMELRGAPHAIDFLHPRQRPAPVSRRKLWISLAAAASVLLLAWLVYGRVTHYLLASEVDGLSATARSLDDSLKKGEKGSKKAADIGKWADQETNWLDKLWGLAAHLPPARDVMLSELTLSNGFRGSQIDLKGWMRNDKVIAEMENGIRTSVGKMNTKDSHEDSSAGDYAWRFEATVRVDQPADEKRDAEKKDAEKRNAEKGNRKQAANVSRAAPSTAAATVSEAAK